MITCDFCNKPKELKAYGYVTSDRKGLMKVVICKECADREGERIKVIEGLKIR